MEEWKDKQEEIPGKPELPISPRQAGWIVFFSIILVFVIGLLIPVLVHLLFGSVEAKSHLLIAELLIVIPPILIVRRYNYPIKNAFRFHSISFSIVLLSLVLGITMAVIGDQMDRIVQSWFPIPNEYMFAMEEIFHEAKGIDFIFVLLISTVGAAVCEEMLFRGFFQQVLEKYFRAWIAIVVAAIIFGLIHFLPWLVLQIALLGIVLGFLAWRTNSVYPSILVHSVNNLITVFYIRYTSPGFEAAYLSGDFVNPIIVLAAIFVFIVAGLRIWQMTHPQSSR